MLLYHIFSPFNKNIFTYLRWKKSDKVAITVMHNINILLILKGSPCKEHFEGRLGIGVHASDWSDLASFNSDKFRSVHVRIIS